MTEASPVPVARRQMFGRVGVSMVGRVMMFRADGPFDPELVAAARRAVQTTLKRMPEVRRFVQLIEFGVSGYISDAGLAELRCFIEEQVGRGILPISTVLLAGPQLPSRDHLGRVASLMGETRPVHIVSTAEEAWVQVNADLVAAGFAAQAPRGSSLKRVARP